MRARQLNMFGNNLQAKFDAWMETDNGKYVYNRALNKSLDLVRRGWKHYGIKSIVESIRYDHARELGPDKDGYLINNNHTAYLARRLMENRPELRDFFKLRELRAE